MEYNNGVRKNSDGTTDVKTDYIHIGRYVLINYRIDPKTRELVNKWTTPDNDDELQLSNIYKQNEYADLDKYKDTFDLTVWQKVFSAGVDKYILVAELKAGTPRLELQTKAPIALVNNEETWTEPTITPITSPMTTKSIKDVYATENVYRYDLPRPLELYVDTLQGEESLLGGADFIAPDKRQNTIKIDDKTEISAPFKNTATWISGHTENNAFVAGAKDDKIDAKQLNLQLYGVGAAIRDVYDVLFGIPNGGSGNRPGYPTDGSLYENLDPTFQEKGLYGILQDLNIITAPSETDPRYPDEWSNGGSYLYFVTKWGDATENSTAFIQNIPQVVTSHDKTANGHYYIDLSEAKLKS